MYKYILKRLLMMIPVLLGVMIAVFTITYFTPGDPARLLLGDGATKEAVEQVHEELGIDDPYIEQLAAISEKSSSTLTSAHPISAKSPSRRKSFSVSPPR